MPATTASATCSPTPPNQAVGPAPKKAVNRFWHCTLGSTKVTSVHSFHLFNAYVDCWTSTTMEIESIRKYEPLSSLYSSSSRTARPPNRMWYLFVWHLSTDRTAILPLCCPLHDEEPAIAQTLNIQDNPGDQVKRNKVNSNTKTKGNTRSAPSTTFTAAPRLARRPTHRFHRCLFERGLREWRSAHRLGSQLVPNGGSAARAGSWSLRTATLGRLVATPSSCRACRGATIFSRGRAARRCRWRRAQCRIQSGHCRRNKDD